MSHKGSIFFDKEIGEFDTMISTGQYSYVDTEDPFHDNVYKYLKDMNPSFFRSHNNYDDQGVDKTGMDSFQIVEPFPPEHEQCKWDFSKLDIKVEEEIKNCEKGTYVFNIRTCPPWMLDKSKAAPLFALSSGEAKDQSFKQLADFCARIVSWYNKGGFTDEKGIYHKSGHYYNIKYWEILNEQDAGESAIYIKSGKQYAKAYDAIVKAIHEIDPDVLCGGPSQSCIPTEEHDVKYLKDFLENAEEAVDFVSVHFYSDHAGLILPDGIKRDRDDSLNIPAKKKYFKAVKDIGRYFLKCRELVNNYGNIPIFVSETNVCLDTKFDYPLALGEYSQNNYGVAWFGYLFKTGVMNGINILQQYQFYCPLNRSRHLKNHISLINNITGEPHLTYWFIKALNDFFNTSGIIVENDFCGDVEVLSVKYPEQKKGILLVINKADGNITEEHSVDIEINLGNYEIKKDCYKLLILDKINKSIEPIHMDTYDRNEISIVINGYGAALIEFEFTV